MILKVSVMQLIPRLRKCIQCTQFRIYAAFIMVGTILVFDENCYFTPLKWDPLPAQWKSKVLTCMYLETLSTIQKKSDKSYHPVLRKQPKRVYLLEYLDVSVKQQN